MESERGVTNFDLLVVLLIVSIWVAIGWPWLMRSGNAGAEGRAKATLKQIHAAQGDFHGGRRHYGTAEQLRDFGVLDTAILAGEQNSQTSQVTSLNLPNTGKYSFNISVNGSRQQWCAVAHGPGLANIALDQSGNFHSGKTCDGGEIR